MRDALPLAAVDLVALRARARRQLADYLAGLDRLRLELEAGERAVETLGAVIAALDQTQRAHAHLGLVMGDVPAEVEAALLDGLTLTAAPAPTAPSTDAIAAAPTENVEIPEEAVSSVDADADVEADPSQEEPDMRPAVSPTPAIAAEVPREAETAANTQDDVLTDVDRAVLIVMRANADAEDLCHLSAARIAADAKIGLGHMRARTFPVLKRLRLIETVSLRGGWAYRVARKGGTLPESADPGTDAPGEEEEGGDAAVAPTGADALDTADVHPAMVAPPAPPRATPAPGPADTRQGRQLLALVTKAAEKGLDLFAVATLAKKLDTTELRVATIVDALAKAGAIERRPVTMKGYVRLGLPEGVEVAA